MSLTNAKPSRKLTNFDFSSKTRRTLARLKRRLGGSAKAIVETALERLGDQPLNPQTKMKFLIWSNQRDAWWKPNEQGYTKAEEHAGEYDLETARRICADAAHYGYVGNPIEPSLTGIS